jgi:hypothetical protein
LQRIEAQTKAPPQLLPGVFGHIAVIDVLVIDSSQRFADVAGRAAGEVWWPVKRRNALISNTKASDVRSTHNLELYCEGMP